jgi:uncharacterized surface protein with fasciclin (FAS1) repeats
MDDERKRAAVFFLAFTLMDTPPCLCHTSSPRYCANPMEATATEASATAAAPEAAPVQPWFNEWAASKGIDGFSRLLQEGGLTGFVESCETPLTIFAPTNEAILAVGNTLPADTQLLRELLCVHITMGSLRWVLRGPSAKNCE